MTGFSVTNVANQWRFSRSRLTEEWQIPERYSLRKTLFLHLAPGVPFTLAFLLAAWLVNRAGGSTYLALILCIPLVLVPCEVGVLIVERRRIRWSWRSIIVPRGSRRVSILDILLSVAAIYAIAQVAGALAIPSRTAILRAMAHWLPPWAVFDGLPDGHFALHALAGPVPLGPRRSDRRGAVLSRFSHAKDSGLRALGSRSQRRPPLDLPLLHSMELSRVLPGFFAAGLLRSTQGQPIADNHHALSLQFRRSHPCTCGRSPPVVDPAGHPNTGSSKTIDASRIGKGGKFYAA